MKEFLYAFQFLTIIPVHIKRMDEKKLGRSLIFFPVVGLILGGALAGILLLSSVLKFQMISTSIIVVVTLIFLTGGIHSDGLTDTFDALLSRKGKEEMLSIMRDPHIGTMGLLSIISSILLKIAFFQSIDPDFQIQALFVMCIASRWSLVFSIYLFPYARKEGKASIFKEKITPNIYVLSTLVALASTLEIARLKGIIALAVVGIFAFFFGRFFKKHLGGMTGDTLGAVNEISEIIVLLCFCIL